MRCYKNLDLSPLSKLKGIYSDKLKRYIKDMVTFKRPHCTEDFLKVARFLELLKNEKYDKREEEPEAILLIGEKIFKYVDGDDTQGYALKDKPFQWMDWQIFDIYSMFLFYHAKTNLRLTKEAFIEVSRKSGKTTYVDVIALSLALKEMKEGGMSIGIVSSSVTYARNLYKILEENILNWYNGSRLRAKRNGWKLQNSNQGILAYHNNFGADENGENGGLIDIEVYAASAEGVHSLRKKLVIIDELHLMKNGASVHSQMRKSTVNSANGLALTITTAAKDKNNYCYEYTEYCKKVLRGVINRDDLYIHIAKADEDEEGKVDILDDKNWYKANPSLGKAVRVESIQKEAEEAAFVGGDLKMSFLAYTLNVFQNKKTTEFQPQKFIVSDMEYGWTLEELAALPITWYGGFDVSLYDDLMAAALYGEYGDIGIIIPHAWCPQSEKITKTTVQNMDLYRWEEEGWFTFCKGETNDPLYIVDFFKSMREKGFSIAEIGFDTRYVTPEVKGELTRAGFDIIREKQFTSHLSLGFRHLEEKAYNHKIYYLHSELYEYCLNNLMVTTKRGNEVYYEKVDKNSKIDAFDASIFAAVRKMSNIEKEKEIEEVNKYLDDLIEEGGFD